MKLLSTASLLGFLTLAQANVYLQSPRGSNNRLNERSAARKNSKRMFYSNNNDRGGYNVGDSTDSPFSDEKGQYAMKYFQSGAAAETFLTVEWTNSLGCGVDQDGDRVHDCKIVLQSMCQTDETNGNPAKKDTWTLRNGKSTETQDFALDPADLPDPQGRCFIDNHQRDLEKRHAGIPHNRPEGSVQWCKNHCKSKGYKYAGLQHHNHCFCDNNFGKYGESDPADCNKKCIDKKDQFCGGTWRNNVFLVDEKTAAPEDLNKKNQRKAKSSNADRGLHESWEFFDRCDYNGTGYHKTEHRYGMECITERQVYPSKTITPWTDIAVFVDQPSTDCPAIKNSNEQEFFECVEFWDSSNTKRKHKSKHITEPACKKAGGKWLSFFKYHSLVADLNEAGCTRANSRNINGFVYKWGRPMIWKDLAEDKLTPEQCFTVPAKTHCHQTPNTRENYLGNIDGDGKSGSAPETPRFQWKVPRYPDNENRRCVFRIRYFVTASDGEQATYSDNDVDVAGNTLKLAVAAKGTVDSTVVFEDRSHVFMIVPRPASIPANQVIHNIVVRGKRGNIVQTFPAVEYDFVPNRLTIPEGDAVHIHWTGSNTHNNGGPAGDGQAGDAGEGRGGTDRHNFVQMAHAKYNFPSPYENHTIFHDAKWLWSAGEKGSDDNKSLNLALSYTSGGYYHCVKKDECARSFEGVKNRLQERFDNAAASYGGNVFVPSAGDYLYQCLRNNNFSNRSQKGRLFVTKNGKRKSAPELRKKRDTEDEDC